MPNLTLTMIPALGPDQRDGGRTALGKLALWASRQISYRRALGELHRLEDRDLDDLNLARADFPELAWRHAMGAEPLARS